MNWYIRFATYLRLSGIDGDSWTICFFYRSAFWDQFLEYKMDKDQWTDKSNVWMSFIFNILERHSKHNFLSCPLQVGHNRWVLHFFITQIEHCGMLFQTDTGALYYEKTILMRENDMQTLQIKYSSLMQWHGLMVCQNPTIPQSNNQHRTTRRPPFKQWYSEVGSIFESFLGSGHANLRSHSVARNKETHWYPALFQFIISLEDTPHPPAQFWCPLYS